MDQYWTDPADFIRGLRSGNGRIVAPREFESLLHLAGTYEDPPSIDTVDVLVLHKGQFKELPFPYVASAISTLSVAFANEVFIVLTRAVPGTQPDQQHLAGWDEIRTWALDSSARPLPTPHLEARLGGRMPATYVGGGRVLLETAFGHLMLVAGADTSITPHLIRDGWFDYGLTSLLNRTLRPGMTYVDVGANFGTYAVIAAAIVGRTGRVVAIEPVPRIADLLNETLVMNGFGDRCQIFRHAAGATEGVHTIHEFERRQGSNTMMRHVAEEAAQAYGEVVSSYEVRCRALDSIIIETGLERLDFLKIDVEGFEQEVLAGAGETISKMRPTLLIEWHSSFFKDIEEGPSSLYKSLTADLGYTLHLVGPQGDIRPTNFDELTRSSHSDVLGLPSQS